MTYVKALAILHLALASLSASACHSATHFLNVDLKGFSQGNYNNLKRGLGREVCITGRMSVDSMGVYYALQPIENDGVIDVGFSRVNTGISRSAALKLGLANNAVHTVCGSLIEATPFEGCDADDCRWYALTNARLRDGGSIGPKRR